MNPYRLQGGRVIPSRLSVTLSLAATAALVTLPAAAAAGPPGIAPLTAAPTLLRTSRASQWAVDTTISVSATGRFDVSNHAGHVQVEGWDRDEIRLRADAPRRRLDLSRSGNLVRLRVRPAGRGGDRHDHADDEDREGVNLRIDVPRRMTVSVDGIELGVTAVGLAGDLTAQTVEGDVTVRDGGYASLRSVDGDIRAEGARGRLEAFTVDGSVHVIDAEGGVSAESVDGDVDLRGVTSDAVDATTTDGDVAYDGALRAGGRYRFSTHDGTVRIRVPPDADATFVLTTYDGEVHNSVDGVRLTEMGGTGGDRRYVLTVGSGAARVEVQAFDGEIELFR